MEKEALRALLLSKHDKAIANEVAVWVGEDPERMAVLMALFFEKHYRLNQRAAWPVGMIGERHPELMQPYLEEMVNHLQGSTIDAVKRNILRTLQYVKLPEALHGIAYTVCFDYLNDVNQAIAIRVFSMTVCHNIALKEPGLMDELKACLEYHLPNGSAGFKSRAKKVLKSIAKRQPD